MVEKKQHIERKRVILLLGILTLVYALLMPDRADMLVNLGRLFTSPTQLITDFFAVAGLSATFANVSGHFFVAHYLMSRNERSNINGLQIGAVGIFTGHAFFGTHLLNILPLILGMVLHAKFTKQSFKLYTTVSLFATALAPFVSYLALHDGLSLRSLAFAVLVGLILGFIAPALAEEFLKFHHGLTLYNYGFTTGIIGMMVVLVLPYLGIEVVGNSQISQGYAPYLFGYLVLVLMVCLALLLGHVNQALKGYGQLIKSTGRVPDDFVSKYGIHTVLLNMSLMLCLYLVLVSLLGVELNGPILGGLLSITGFSAFGKHPRNALPVALGVFLGAKLLGQSVTELRFVLALLFGTGLSPISGFYGFHYGVLAGFLHYNLSGTVFGLHQGFSLYNNGFSTGFVAAFLVPIIDSLQDHKQYWIRKK